jgi:hypothetical protein
MCFLLVEIRNHFIWGLQDFILKDAGPPAFIWCGHSG